MKGFGTIFGIAVLCISSAVIGAWIFNRFFHQASPALSGDLVGNPGMDAVESYQCPRHLRKNVQIMGVEDGYDRSNDEPARYHPAFYFSPRFVQFKDNELGSLSIRDYDETGSDKFLFDYVTFPKNTQSAQIFYRARFLNGSRNDNFNLNFPLDEGNGKYTFFAVPHTGRNMSSFEVLNESRTSQDKVITHAIPDIISNYDFTFRASLSDFLSKSDKDTIAIISTGDDIQVDFAALVTCESMNEKRGTTFTEIYYHYLPNDRSLLSCEGDLDDRFCDAHRGDYECTSALPLACYKPGNKSVDGFVNSELMKGTRPIFNPDYFIGGEVKLTPPVKGNALKTRGDVNAFCNENFGSGWRALNYHESGAGRIATWSDIPDDIRVWVDVFSTPHGNCWSADLTESPSD